MNALKGRGARSDEDKAMSERVSRIADRAALGRQYSSSRNLTARASLYRYLQTPLDFVGWMLSHTSWPEGALVADVGCGPGWQLARLLEMAPEVHPLAVDLSLGMVTEARSRSGAAGAVGSAQDLPLADRSVDRIIAAHMLYHCPDPAGAVAELRRVLCDGGELLVVLNGPDHMRRYVDARHRAARAPVGWASDRVGLQHAPDLLRPHFGDVRIECHRGEVVVPEVEPVLAYFDSGRDFVEPRLPEGRTWNQARAAFATEISAEIERTGAWRSPVETGVVIAR